jgi:hypothetical protein
MAGVTGVCACMPFWAQLWALTRLRACVMRLQVKTGRVRGCAGLGVQRRCCTGVPAFLGPRSRDRAYKLAQKEEGTVLVLTVFLDRTELQSRVVGVVLRQWRRNGAR